MTSAQRIVRTSQFQARVVSALSLSPRMRRIVLTAPGIADTRWPLACDIALVLRAPDGREVRRRYTVRNQHDACIVVDAALHGPGPGSEWAARAAPGDEIGFFGPRGEIPLADPDLAVLMITDESGLPAIAALTEKLERPVRIVAEIADDAEHYPLPETAEVRWLPRDGRPAGDAAHLIQAASAWAPGEFCYVLAESRAAVGIRDALGLSRDRSYAKGYWNLNSRPTK